MGACNSKPPRANPYAPRPPNDHIAPLSPPKDDDRQDAANQPHSSSPFFPFYTPSPAYLWKKSPAAAKTKAKSANSTPLAFFRRPFPPPSPAKHIRAVLRRRRQQQTKKDASTAAIPEAEEEEAVELDKRFGFSRELTSMLEVGEEVGRGHFGYTCCGRYKKGILKGQQVAVKIIHKAKMTTAIAVEDVRREVKILRALTGHNNLVQFYDAFEDHDNVYIVMELCEGGELLDRILSRGGKYSEDDAKAVLVQILNVVAFCHIQGVVHRDLKPESKFSYFLDQNFLYTSKDENSQLKAIDFGLSDFVRPDERLNDIVGSAYYVAPEVLHRAYGIEADVWSIGVIAYILLCGSRPFWAQTESGIFRAVLKADPSFDEGPWPSLSTEAKDFVKRLLNKDSRKRMTAAQALSHPWIRNFNRVKVPLDILVFKLMKAYMRSSSLRKAALKALSKTLTLDELFYLKEQFAQLEPDKNGSISLESIKKVGSDDKCNRCNEGISVHQLEALDRWEQHARCAYELFEKDGNRAIVIEELASVKLSPMLRIKKLRDELGLGPSIPPKKMLEMLLYMFHLLCLQSPTLVSVVAFRLLSKIEINNFNISIITRPFDLAVNLSDDDGTFVFSCLKDTCQFCDSSSGGDNWVQFAEKVYTEMVRSKISPNVFTYNILIRGFCVAGNIEMGLSFFSQMEKNGCLANVVTYNTLIDGYCKLRRIDKALELLRTMCVKGIEPNLISFNVIINGLCREGRLKETSGVLNEMTRKGFVPDEVTYNTLVNGHCKEGDFHQALVLHAEMVKNGLSPNVVTYTSLINSMCKAGNMNRAIEFFDQMHVRGLRPNQRTYTTLVDGFSQLGYVDEAYRVLNEMTDNGFVPSIVTYNALINGHCVVGKIEEAVGVIQNMIEKGLVPDVVSYSTIISGFCRNRELDKAFDIKREMVEKGVSPDAITYASLIQGLCYQGRLAEACDLFQEMLSIGLPPDEIAYTTLINAYCAEGDIKTAFHLHDEMIQKGFLPDVVTYSVLINGLNKQARTREAKRLLLKLFYNESVPSDVTYNTLIENCSNIEFKSVVALMKGFCMKGLMNEADKVLESMLQRNHKPTEAVYNVIIHGHCKGGNVKKAYDLYKEMVTSDFVPHTVTVIALVKALFSEGMSEELSQVIGNILRSSRLTDAELAKALLLQVMHGVAIVEDTILASLLVAAFLTTFSFKKSLRGSMMISWLQGWVKLNVDGSSRNNVLGVIAAKEVIRDYRKGWCSGFVLRRGKGSVL
ncbi:hypothetical protein JRO89_XS02G0061400 [Xanthoceras sorbifolium]|uniref:Protein kinase domain-containing protein n=1 Tax=Xanthoceras sorbifolium TaxID=99658 RepID=A0ABQ8IFC1_9ROSI|nr:hypothetical protein JRO89_XS02G0061400 [Xanthoceras sorbifolium]